MTTVTSISDGGGGLKPAVNYPNHYGADFNGSSYCFILDQDLATADSRVLNSPTGVLTELVSSPLQVPSDFLGMHFHKIYNNTTKWPTNLTPSFVRSHDGGLRWQEINTSSTVYNWSYLDNWLLQVEQRGCMPIFTVYGTPSWASARPSEASAYGINGLAAEPANMADLAAFVTAVASRYGTRIKYYEVWNEPNLTDFYTGTKAKLVDMVKTVSVAVKAVNPNAKVICPAITSFTENAGNNGEIYLTTLLTQQDTAATGTMLNWIDIVGIHLYRNAQTVPLFKTVQRIKNTLTAGGYGSFDIWDTENGILSPYPNLFSSDDHAKIMKRKIVAVACSGIKKMGWYSYDNGLMGFINNDTVIEAYEDVQAKICGAIITRATQLINGTLYIKTDTNKEYYF